MGYSSGNTFNEVFQEKLVDADSGEVLTLTYNDGCVRMSIQGPDNVLVADGVSEEVKNWLKVNPLAIKETSRLPKRQKVSKARHAGSKMI